jgi:hypothetical protein
MDKISCRPPRRLERADLQVADEVWRAPTELERLAYLHMRCALENGLVADEIWSDAVISATWTGRLVCYVMNLWLYTLYYFPT